ncbi:MAG: zinc ABC transporter solute-binding protein [Microscillaceae bacterium]|nr:zinc ABC transporter solute-binding protein [Microscillaceae bacterium]
MRPKKYASRGGRPDPHIWFDVQLWEEASVFVAQKMAEKYPNKAVVFQKNLKEYQAKLRQLDEELRQSLRQIPKAQRVLITAHDAFGYFGQAYNMEVKGLQGISTLSEFGLRDVKELVDFIVARRIKAVFVESAISPKSLEAVVQGCAQKGHKIRIGGTLYADAMGGADTPAGTYLGMVRANLRTITEALQ